MYSVRVLIWRVQCNRLCPTPLSVTNEFRQRRNENAPVLPKSSRLGGFERKLALRGSG